MNDVDFEQWWLARLGNNLIWSRLRLRPSGTAEVLDSSGTTVNYDSEDSARTDLLDAGFQALDGFDDDDALSFGLPLEALVPPSGDDTQLHLKLVQAIPLMH